MPAHDKRDYNEAPECGNVMSPGITGGWSCGIKTVSPEAHRRLDASQRPAGREEGQDDGYH